MNGGIEKYISMVLPDEHKLHIANKVKLKDKYLKVG